MRYQQETAIRKIELQPGDSTRYTIITDLLAADEPPDDLAATLADHFLGIGAGYYPRGGTVVEYWQVEEVISVLHSAAVMDNGVHLTNIATGHDYLIEWARESHLGNLWTAAVAWLWYYTQVALAGNPAGEGLISAVYHNERARVLAILTEVA